MGSYCGCGRRLTWAAVPQKTPGGAVEVVEATQCLQCDLDLPPGNTTVHIDGKEFAYHATRECRHMVEESDWSTVLDNAEKWAVPCSACFGGHDPESEEESGNE